MAPAALIPTTEPHTDGTQFPAGEHPKVLGPGTGDDKTAAMLQTLLSYKEEAQRNRASGDNPRDDKWQQNLNLYWNRYDFSSKAPWQSKETMPEVPAFVDRFAAALKEALTSQDFYVVEDPYDPNNDLTPAVKAMTDVWLSTAGRNANGQPLEFSSVFEEQMKLGAIMAASAVVTWKGDYRDGRVAVETQDPRNVWLDHTYRGLYRLRTTEVDRYDLIAMAKTTSRKGKPIFHLDAMKALADDLSQQAAEEAVKRAALTGSGSDEVAQRQTVKLDEYIATVLGPDGTVMSDKGLVVVANDKHIIRGPEANPFWHQKDWLLYAPLVTAPLSVYGRSYMEDFGPVAKTFNELTNLILDAAQNAAIKAYVMVPEMLLNPAQANEPVSPGKRYLLEEGYDIKQFATALDLGTLPPEAVNVWQSLKTELSEAAGINEVGMGQFAPRSRTSATEIMETQQSSSAIVRSIAQTVEARFLNPMLDLIWKTGLQHVSPGDARMQQAVGQEMFGALMSQRRQLIGHPITFQARGISALIRRSQMLQRLLQIMQIIAQNENLTAAFMQRVDMGKLVKLLFSLSNVDIRQLELSERERLMQGVTQQLSQAGQQGTPSDAGGAAMGDLAGSLGIGA